MTFSVIYNLELYNAIFFTICLIFDQLKFLMLYNV